MARWLRVHSSPERRNISQQCLVDLNILKTQLYQSTMKVFLWIFFSHTIPECCANKHETWSEYWSLKQRSPVAATLVSKNRLKISKYEGERQIWQKILAYGVLALHLSMEKYLALILIKVGWKTVGPLRRPKASQSSMTPKQEHTQYSSRPCRRWLGLRNSRENTLHTIYHPS